ncbi:thioesterase family protein [Micrococcus sp.]|uniref:thioesterase family protein n=1 Tax=Micrococcus sp. TaxID=1271 RepID=UPI002A913CC1|nr:thioesterase family protein [Micrococcus sp.]MDY6054636.1 thioesterase family protein [Micrococcus sp.]
MDQTADTDQAPAPGADPRAFFVRLGPPETAEGVRTSRMRSTVHAQGAWRAEEMHMAAVSGLLLHEVLAHETTAGLRVARLSYDILGTLWGGELEVRTRTLRPGRTIELVESVLRTRGRDVLTLRAWLLGPTDTAAVAVLPDEPLAPRPQTVEGNAMSVWPGGYIASLTGAAVEGHAPGHGRVWLSTDVEMVAGEPTPDVVRLIGLADTANGIAPALPARPGGWFFPNVDLQIHLVREPAGRWLGLAGKVSVGPDGVGLTSTVLHDDDGPFAHAEQTLTVRHWPEEGSL